MTTTQDDLDALAASVRFFLDQEIPNVDQWNVDPEVLHDSLLRIGTGFTDVETTVAAIQSSLTNIINPDGSAKPPGEWVTDTATPSYVAATTFTMVGDRSTSYHAGMRLRATISGSTLVIGTVQSVAYNAGGNVTTFVLTTGVLDAALSKIEYSIVRDSAPAARTVDILDLQVTVAKLADLAVATGKIADLAVTAAKLANLAVQTANIADGAVTNLKVGFKSLVGSERLVDGSVNASVTLADSSITTPKLANQSVTAAKLAPGAVSGGVIAPASIQTSMLAPGSVTNPIIADGAVTSAKIADYTIQAVDIADNTIYGGVTRNHIVDKSIWAANKLADRSVAYNNIAIGHVRGSWNGVQNEIGQQTIWGESDIAYKSIWGVNRIADASIPWQTLAQNAALYQVIQWRAGNGTLYNNGQTWDLINGWFSTRGSWCLAMFAVNGNMRAGQQGMGAQIVWLLDGGEGQGYNVAAMDPGEAGNPTQFPMHVGGYQWWNPPAGNHTWGIRARLYAGQGNNRYFQIQNADLMIAIFA